MGRWDSLSLQASKALYSLCALAIVLTFFSSVRPVHAESNTVRIVSLAPSITEIVFAIGLGERLVGVTRYCDYPKAAREIAKVGGLADPNLERIVALRPSIVFGLPEHAALGKRLASLGIPSSLNRQASFDDIFASILSIGTILKQDESAEKLVREMKSQIAGIRQRTEGRSRPTVLVTVGGHVKRASLDAIYAAGSTTLYQELIELAGGENVLSSAISYAKLSAEALLTLNPDIVIDLVPTEAGVGSAEAASIRKETLVAWNTLPKLQAVQDKRVYIFSQEFVVNPGPRTTRTLQLFADAIHPNEKAHAPR